MIASPSDMPTPDFVFWRAEPKEEVSRAVFKVLEDQCQEGSCLLTTLTCDDNGISDGCIFHVWLTPPHKEPVEMGYSFRRWENSMWVMVGMS